MINFDIGKKIKAVIEANSGLTQDLSDAKGDLKVFPLIADEGTTFPFIVYRRSGYSPRNDKDYMGEMLNVNLILAHTKYAESLRIANELSDVLQTYSDEDIEEIRVMNLSEDWSMDTYIQHIDVLIQFR